MYLKIEDCVISAKLTEKKNVLAPLQTSSSEVQPKCLLHLKPEAPMWFMFMPNFRGCKPFHRQSRCAFSASEQLKYLNLKAA
jgi:hypothetical protein